MDAWPQFPENPVPPPEHTPGDNDDRSVWIILSLLLIFFVALFATYVFTAGISAWLAFAGATLGGFIGVVLTSLIIRAFFGEWPWA